MCLSAMHSSGRTHCALRAEITWLSLNRNCKATRSRCAVDAAEVLTSSGGNGESYNEDCGVCGGQEEMLTHYIEGLVIRGYAGWTPAHSLRKYLAIKCQKLLEHSFPSMLYSKVALDRR